MPCDSIILNTVDLDVASMNEKLMLAGLRDEFGAANVYGVGRRYVVHVDGVPVVIERGQASSALPTARVQEVVGRVKQAYSREVVKESARKFGWTLKPGKDKNNFQIVKR